MVVVSFKEKKGEEGKKEKKKSLVKLHRYL